MAHGLDHTITGIRAMISGQYQDSATTQLLEKTGMRHDIASNIDALLGFTGGIYGVKALNAATRNAFPQFAWSIEVENISKTPYEIAKQGGRHAGFIKNNIFRSNKELEKGISSLERQIFLHKNKISNPKKYYPNWTALDLRQRNNLINKRWPAEIKGYEEQKEILQSILNERLFCGR